MKGREAGGGCVEELLQRDDFLPLDSLLELRESPVEYSFERVGMDPAGFEEAAQSLVEPDWNIGEVWGNQAMNKFVNESPASSTHIHNERTAVGLVVAEARARFFAEELEHISPIGLLIREQKDEDFFVGLFLEELLPESVTGGCYDLCEYAVGAFSVKRSADDEALPSLYHRPFPKLPNHISEVLIELLSHER